MVIIDWCAWHCEYTVRYLLPHIRPFSYKSLCRTLRTDFRNRIADHILRAHQKSESFTADIPRAIQSCLLKFAFSQSLLPSCKAVVMAASKFTEVLSPHHQPSLPEWNVRLEDILAETANSNRSSSGSAKSGNEKQSGSSSKQESPRGRLRKMTLSGKKG